MYKQATSRMPEGGVQASHTSFKREAMPSLEQPTFHQPSQVSISPAPNIKMGNTSSVYRRHIERMTPLVIPTISPSIVENESISLPLVGPFHVYMTTPFSLLVQDFDPNTKIPPGIQPAPWWRPNWLFGPRFETPCYAGSWALFLTNPAFSKELWPKLSALLFGKEEPALHSIINCNIEDWQQVIDSNLLWAFSTGVTDDNIDNIKAVVLKPINDPSRPGRFTVEELGPVEDAAWKRVLGDTEPWESPEESQETDIDVEMRRRNFALSWYMRDRGMIPSDEKKFAEKESVESD